MKLVVKHHDGTDLVDYDSWEALKYHETEQAEDFDVLEINESGVVVAMYVPRLTFERVSDDEFKALREDLNVAANS